MSEDKKLYRGRDCREYSLAYTLYDAIQDNDYKGVTILLQKGADPNLVLSCGLSPFHLVIGNESDEFAIKVTKLLLQYNGNPNIQSDEGLAPLHIAAAWNRIDLVRLLLKCGADSGIRDFNGYIPLFYAIEYNNTELITLLHNDMFSNAGKCNIEENLKYDLVLDRVFIYNGLTEGEYKVEEEAFLELRNLQRLPQTNPNEYVRNWCRTHAAASQEHIDETNKELIEKSNDTSGNSYKSNESNAFDRRFVNCTRRINKNVIENFSLSYEPSVKFKKRREAFINKPASSTSKETITSTESGILTFPEALSSDENSTCHYIKNKAFIIKKQIDTSSDYFTSNELSGSTNVLDQNIFDSVSNNDVTPCNSNNLQCDTSVHSDGTIHSFYRSCNAEDGKRSESRQSSLRIAEVYKYTDNTEGIVLYEKRLLKAKNGETESLISPSKQSQSSKISSLPATLDYDTDVLSNELIKHAFQPGPITKTTKRVYLKMLRRLKREVSSDAAVSSTNLNCDRVYSTELECTLKNPNWVDNLNEYKIFEEVIYKEFTKPDPYRKWREGLNKSSFTYLLLDPRLTKNLPSRADEMSLDEIWKTFLSSIFYIGKGKRTRPYSHLYEAVKLWRYKTNKDLNKKLQRILNIWNDNYGVVCLHVYQNIIPVEAYTREAAMINALKIENLENMRVGDFYGTASTWTSKEQNKLGVLLLYKAMMIFLNEGERQLKPADIN